MVENMENEGRVDLDEENYMEEIDDDVEEQIDHGIEVDSDDNNQGDEEEDEDPDEDEENEDSRRVDTEKVQLEEDSRTQLENEDSRRVDTEKVQLEEDSRTQLRNESDKYEEQPISFINEEDREKHAELLAHPPHGSEVFLGGLPRDTSEKDLKEHCETIGKISEIRLAKNETNESKGYAFISFASKDAAQKAIEELHNKAFKGKMLRCTLSEVNYRLFIGNVPKNLTGGEFSKILKQIGPGVGNIELIKDPQFLNRNRGFAFVEFYNNACADYSRKKMASANFKLEGNTPTITWAGPKITAENSASAAATLQVKALYVKNIPDNTTTEQVKELFERHGEVTKVVIPLSKTGIVKRDFGFIHYADRSSALKAVNDNDKHEINGQVLEVVLARPQSDRKTEVYAPHNSGIHSNYRPYEPAYGGFRFPTNPYGTIGAGYGVAPIIHQPMIYGRGPMPAGMQMVPMVLPDGQIGYVLQQSGMQMAAPLARPGRNGYSGFHGRSGGRGDSNRGRRYRPYYL